jgi:hypothetical protein
MALLKDRHIQIKFARDGEDQAASSAAVQLDADKITENVVVGTCAIIVVYKVTSLICRAAEHVVVTKVK